jgi:ribonuclease BN (tRNA processing enzyme)
MNDYLILLGVKGGPAIRQRGAAPSASLLRLSGQTLLVDCGLGVTRSLVEAGTALLDIDAIFITHLHSDHILELGPLLYTAWTTGLDRKICVFGPEGTTAYLDNFLQAMRFDHEIRVSDEGRPDIRTLIQTSTIGHGSTTAIGAVSVTTLRVDHPPVIECYALRFESGAKSIVFSSDTCYFPPLADFARGATILVHEAMLIEGIENLARRTPAAKRLREHLLASHTSARDAGRIASAATVRSLVLNHLVPADDSAFGEVDWLREVSEAWQGPTIIGKDGLTLSIE